MKTWYQTKFPARYDPGPNVMAWPPDFQAAIQGATTRLRDKHPWLSLGRVITCETWVTRDSPLIDFPFHVHVSLLFEHPTVQ